MYSIQHIQAEKPELQKIILLAHAVSGCDTTSAVYRKGKITSVKILQEEGMQNIVSVFDDPNSSKERITAAMCTYILQLYGAKKRRSQ